LRRTFSGLLFPVKRSTGGCFRLVGVGPAQLRETRLAEAAIAAEEATAGAEHRLGGNSRQLIAQVGFVERPDGDPMPPQLIHALEQTALVRNATDDEMRMGQMLREEKPCRLDGGMARLDDLVGGREVDPDEDVDVGDFVVLREFHGTILER
jgi:hypothetical protein